MFGSITEISDSSVRALLASCTLLLLPACTSQYLDEAAELGIHHDNVPALLDETAGDSDDGNDNRLDISGLYLSEITSNHPAYFKSTYRKLLLRVTQQGNQITAFDSTYQLKLDGHVKNNKIEFYLYPSRATWLVAISGTWTVDADGRLTGSWQSTNLGADGTWNLRKLEANGIEFYTTEQGMDDPVSINEADIFFDRLFSRDEDRNIVFYLHGRGRKFRDLFDDGGVPFIEDYSETRFVIIAWLSWGDVTIRPYNHAVASANGIAEFLYAFDHYKARYADKLGNRKITLLAHSMGNIPVAAFLKYRYRKGSLQKGLFDSIIFSSADIPFPDHRQWMEKCDFSNQVFVTQHHRDYILDLSRVFFSPEDESDSFKLGSGLDLEEDGHLDQLAGNVNYLDLTNLTFAGHKHFSRTGTLPLFKLLLNGRELDYPDPSIGLYRKSVRHPVFYFYSSDPDRVEDLPDSE